MVRRMRDKELSAREVLEAHLARIARLNPQVNAIVTLAEEEARAQALRADEGAARGEFLGPLHGLPIAFKDLTETRGLRTTFGSPIFKDYVPDFSTLLAERTQGGRRHHHRQNQHARIRRWIADLQSHFRAHPESLGPVEDLRRFERRRGGGAGLRDAADRRWH